MMLDIGPSAYSSSSSSDLFLSELVVFEPERFFNHIERRIGLEVTLLIPSSSEQGSISDEQPTLTEKTTATHLKNV